MPASPSYRTGPWPDTAVSARATPEADPRRLQGFAPSGGPEHRRRGLGRDAPGSSLGLAPLQGFTDPRRVRRFTPGNFLDLRAIAFRTEARLTSTTGVCEAYDRGSLPGLSRDRAAPLEVSHLVTSLDSTRASSTRAHVFTSGSEPRHRAPASPLGVDPPSPLSSLSRDRVSVLPRSRLWTRVRFSNPTGWCFIVDSI
jgi:hypothetical protein